MSFPKYPEYKDSGVEWLGEVPSHWSVKAIKWLSPVLRGASPRPIDDPKYFDDDGEYAWVRIADSTASTGILTETTQRLSALGSSLSVKLEIGQLFVSIAGTVGKPCITAIKACIHDGFVYFPRLQINPKFLFRIFEAGVCYGGLGKMGTQLNLNTDTIGSIRIAVPPPEEMTEVLSFIDHETAKIDALVAEQEKLIALLQEKRQAVISHAVTKGLNPNVPMKDSGVEWLGEVPGHWVVGGLTRFIGPVVDYRGRTPTKVDEGIFLVTARNIRDGRIDYEASEEFVDPDSAASLLARGKPEIDDLLFTMEAPLGQVALIDRTDIALAQRVVKFRGVPTLMRNSYLLYWLMSTGCQSRLETLATGSTALGIKASKLGMIECLAPPLDEQDSIVALIKHETAKLDTLMTEARTAITLLQERRTALISAAVTGQIDVRGWVLADTASKFIAASVDAESVGG